MNVLCIKLLKRFVVQGCLSLHLNVAKCCKLHHKHRFVCCEMACSNVYLSYGWCIQNLILLSEKNGRTHRSRFCRSIL